MLLPETRYPKSGGVNIAYQVVGGGPLDLAYVMGWVSHLDYFWEEPSYERFLTRLTSFSRLILFDKRGTGLSDRVSDAELPTLEQRMDDVRAVMEAVGSERAALFGVSEAGPMSALFAASFSPACGADPSPTVSWRPSSSPTSSVPPSARPNWATAGGRMCWPLITRLFAQSWAGFVTISSIRQVMVCWRHSMDQVARCGAPVPSAIESRDSGSRSAWARVAALASPDEVLTSGTVKDLVAGSGIQFVDRGSHTLKGVPGEWRLFAATGVN